MVEKRNYFITRIFILCLFTGVIGWFYEIYFHPSTLKTEGWLKTLGEKSFSKRADVLYFSASPNLAVAQYDTDRRSIHDKIQFYLKSSKIESLDTGAIHAGVFLHALKQLPKNYTPKVVLMDLNLRSFGQMWIQSGLENSLQRNLAYWNDYPGLLNRMSVALKNYDYIGLHERNSIIDYNEKFTFLPFPGNCKSIKKWVDSLNTRPDHQDGKGRELVRNFGFKIDSKNEMLAHYDAVISYCESQNIKLVFLLLPENMEAMELTAGKQLVSLCEKNVSFLKTRFKNTPIIDLSSSLPNKHFFEQYPTEHYDSEGREIVALKTAQTLNHFLK